MRQRLAFCLFVSRLALDDLKKLPGQHSTHTHATFGCECPYPFQKPLIERKRDVLFHFSSFFSLHVNTCDARSYNRAALRPQPLLPIEQLLIDTPEQAYLAAFNAEERLKDAIGDYYASPVAADGKIYFVNKEGNVTVISAGANWKPLSSGDLDAQVIAAPAIAASRIYIRTDASLYCFGTKPPV